MKFLIPGLLLLVLILTQSCSSSKKTNSSAEGSTKKFYSRYFTPEIDGKMSEWGDSLSYDNSTKCLYSIANDESALYIGIKAKDRMQQMKIMQGGMEIWINDKLKKNKTIGVKFPVGSGMSMMPSNNAGKAQDSSQMRAQLMLQMLTMELTGFREGLNGLQKVSPEVQVKPAITWDSKEGLVYELVIPFSSLNETVAANLNNISIGIFINGLKDAGNGPPGGGMMPPGGGPPPGAGGMPPGGMGDMPDQRRMQDMTKENSFWTKYTIAKR